MPADKLQYFWEKVLWTDERKRKLFDKLQTFTKKKNVKGKISHAQTAEMMFHNNITQKAS